MEFSYVFYKEIPLDEDNVFSANLTENNGVEQVKFKKSKIYAVRRLSTDFNTTTEPHSNKKPLNFTTTTITLKILVLCGNMHL